MMRLITAPCVGIVVGAFEEGFLFAILTLLDPTGSSAGEWVFLGAIIGMIGGGFVGGFIGLVVALRDARSREGVLLGSAIGLAFAVLVAIQTGANLVAFIIGSWGDPVEHYSTIVALSMIPAGASIGFVSAVSTAADKEPQPAAEPSRSHRIFE